MGLLDSIVGQAVDAMTDSDSNSPSGLTDVVTSMLGGANPAGAAGGTSGGLGALIALFNQKGLGNLIASWIGTGQNQPISGDQLSSVLGSEQIGMIAQKLGMSSGDASGALAKLLPQVIDQLTPNGEVPDSNLLEQGLSMLKGLQRNA